MNFFKRLKPIIILTLVILTLLLFGVYKKDELSEWASNRWTKIDKEENKSDLKNLCFHKCFKEKCDEQYNACIKYLKIICITELHPPLVLLQSSLCPHFF